MGKDNLGALFTDQVSNSMWMEYKSLSIEGTVSFVLCSDASSLMLFVCHGERGEIQRQGEVHVYTRVLKPLRLFLESL